MDTRTIVCFVLVVAVTSPTVDTKKSRACFGSGGVSNTNHNLKCSPGAIHINEAYFTDNVQCGGGLSANLKNFASIKEANRVDAFNPGEIKGLEVKCSGKPECSIQANRRVNIGGSYTFSVIQYHCGGGGETSVGEETDPTQTGAIVGGVIGGVCVLVVLTILVFVVFRRRRSKQKENTTDLPAEAANCQDVSNTYDEIDHADVNTNTYLTIEPDRNNDPGFTRPTPGHSTYDDDYNQTGHSTTFMSSNYDTIESVSRSVQSPKHTDGYYDKSKLRDKPCNGYDTTSVPTKKLSSDSSYDHIGDLRSAKTLGHYYDEHEPVTHNSPSFEVFMGSTLDVIMEEPTTPAHDDKLDFSSSTYSRAAQI